MISLAILALVLGGGWLWLKDSPLVAVKQVAVSGESGPDAGAIRTALESTARSMTTLDVQMSKLYSAVSGYPVVKSLQVTTQFPHGMRIHVSEELPVAVVVLSGQPVAVAADGTLLHDLSNVPALPRINLSVPPGGPRLSEPQAVESLAAATTAPRQLLRRITMLSTAPDRGVVAHLRDGPEVYLGTTARLRAKWAAAIAVLADPGSEGASYIDVTDPARPAAGVSQSSSAQTTSTSGTRETPPARSRLAGGGRGARHARRWGERRAAGRCGYRAGPCARGRHVATAAPGIRDATWLLEAGRPGRDVATGARAPGALRGDRTLCTPAKSLDPVARLDDTTLKLRSRFTPLLPQPSGTHWRVWRNATKIARGAGSLTGRIPNA